MSPLTLALIDEVGWPKMFRSLRRAGLFASCGCTGCRACQIAARRFLRRAARSACFGGSYRPPRSAVSFPVYSRALAGHQLRLLVGAGLRPSIVGVRLDPLPFDGQWPRAAAWRRRRARPAVELEHELELEAEGVAYPAALPAAGTAASALGAAAARIALEEWKRWGQGQTKETSSNIRPVLQDYWLSGVGQLPEGASWWSSTPWSGAFISWVMRKAGAGSSFQYSGAHTDYVAAAKRNRQAGVGLVQAYRVSEAAPRVGDIVCQERSNSGVTYDNVDQGFHSSHCDIVTEVRSGSISVVGGNLSDSVSRNSVKTDARGYISAPGFYAVLRVGGGPLSVPGQASPPPAPTNAGDPAIDALQLLEPARAAAYSIKARHPWVAFTSGRRNPESQASAMAGNVVRNRQWIGQTYSKNTVSVEAQAWVDSHPEARTKEAIAAGLLQVFLRFSPTELGRLSYHLSGLAFDIRPVPSKLAELSATIRSLPRLKEFLTREGGLEIWHVAFA